MRGSTWRVAAVLVLLVFLATCGGGGGGEQFFPEDPDDGLPVARGDAVVIEFIPPEATSADELGFEAEIGPVGSSNPQASRIRFRVLNAQGLPARNGIRVLFTLEGPLDASLSTLIGRTANGFVETVLRAGETAGNAVVVAQVRGTNLIARSAVVSIGRARGAATAIEFFGLRVPGLFGDPDDPAQTPEERTQLGIRGSGFNQAVDVVFALLDDHGAAAADGVVVDFTLFGPNGGESISPTTALSSEGFVSATISTGSRPGPVQVEARVRGTTIFARAIPITIGSALNPPANRLSIAVECLNVAGSVTFGLEDEIRAGLSDQFGNPIPIGSAVSFFAEGGVIKAQGISEDGIAATAILVTQSPIPADRRVTVMAVTTGQEAFTDVNGSGHFEPGEPFVDLPNEVFLDANEDGVWQVGEFFIDNNNNGVFDATPNGVWDDQILIEAQGVIVFSGRTVITIDPTTFDIPPGGSQQFILTVSDDIGSALVGGTQVMISATNGTVFPTTITIPDSNLDATAGPIPGLTQFTITLVSETLPTDELPPPRPTALTIEVQSPTGDGVECPGGNGNASLTIFGTVQ